MKTLIEVSDLHHHFAQRQLFKGLQLNINPSEVVAFVGPSGCGKSTLLRLLAGLISPSQGKVSYHNFHNEVAFVFQEPRLLPWRNVLENTLLPIELKKKIEKADEQEAFRRLEQMGLKGAENFFPHQLSGGMKMRVSLARALVLKPKILFLDEPFAALDEQTRESLQLLVREQAEKEKLTVALVTHSLSEAAFMAEQIFLLNKDGELRRTIKHTDSEVWKSPRTLRLKDSTEFFSFLREFQLSFREVNQ